MADTFTALDWFLFGARVAANMQPVSPDRLTQKAMGEKLANLANGRDVLWSPLFGGEDDHKLNAKLAWLLLSESVADPDYRPTRPTPLEKPRPPYIRSIEYNRGCHALECRVLVEPPKRADELPQVACVSVPLNDADRPERLGLFEAVVQAFDQAEELARRGINERNEAPPAELLSDQERRAAYYTSRCPVCLATMSVDLVGQGRNTFQCQKCGHIEPLGRSKPTTESENR